MWGWVFVWLVCGFELREVQVSCGAILLILLEYIGLGWPGPRVPAALRGGPQGSAEGIVALASPEES